MFNTGSIEGFSFNIYGTGFPDKYISSFAWCAANTKITYKLQNNIETAKKVLQSRNQVLKEHKEKIN